MDRDLRSRMRGVPVLNERQDPYASLLVLISQFCENFLDHDFELLWL